MSQWHESAIPLLFKPFSALSEGPHWRWDQPPNLYLTVQRPKSTGVGCPTSSPHFKAFRGNIETGPQHPRWQHFFIFGLLQWEEEEDTLFNLWKSRSHKVKSLMLIAKHDLRNLKMVRSVGGCFNRASNIAQGLESARIITRELTIYCGSMVSFLELWRQNIIRLLCVVSCVHWLHSLGSWRW